MILRNLMPFDLTTLGNVGSGIPGPRLEFNDIQPGQIIEVFHPSRGFGRGAAVSITRRKFGYLALNCDTRTADTGGMKQRRENNRDMCAELLTVRWTDGDGRTRSEAATLEDISATGACLQLEHSILPETQVSLHYPKGKYQGKVKYCTYHDIGYLLGMAFDDGYRWSKTDFEPSHLLELPVKKS